MRGRRSLRNFSFSFLFLPASKLYFLPRLFFSPTLLLSFFCLSLSRSICFVSLRRVNKLAIRQLAREPPQRRNCCQSEYSSRYRERRLKIYHVADAETWPYSLSCIPRWNMTFRVYHVPYAETWTYGLSCSSGKTWDYGRSCSSRWNMTLWFIMYPTLKYDL